MVQAVAGPSPSLTPREAPQMPTFGGGAVEVHRIRATNELRGCPRPTALRARELTGVAGPSRPAVFGLGAERSLVQIQSPRPHETAAPRRFRASGTSPSERARGPIGVQSRRTVCVATRYGAVQPTTAARAWDGASARAGAAGPRTNAWASRRVVCRSGGSRCWRGRSASALPQTGR